MAVNKQDEHKDLKSCFAAKFNFYLAVLRAILRSVICSASSISVFSSRQSENDAKIEII